MYRRETIFLKYLIDAYHHKFRDRILSSEICYTIAYKRINPQWFSNQIDRILLRDRTSSASQGFASAIGDTFGTQMHQFDSAFDSSEISSIKNYTNFIPRYRTRKHCFCKFAHYRRINLSLKESEFFKWEVSFVISIIKDVQVV